MRLFISYNFQDTPFVLKVADYLGRQPEVEPYFYSNEKKPYDFESQIEDELKKSDGFVLFVGKIFGNVQQVEAQKAQEKYLQHKAYPILKVNLPGSCAIPFLKTLNEYNRLDSISLESRNEVDAANCAREIVTMLVNKNLLTPKWVPIDGLPIGYPFAYEKAIIEAYKKISVSDSAEYDEEWRNKLLLGVPAAWPEAAKIASSYCYTNEIPEKIIGKRRQETSRVVVDARISMQAEKNEPVLEFLEAGPRDKLCHPRSGSNELRVGILVSGGIAPGINAVIAGIVECHCTYANRSLSRYYKPNIRGYKNGFAGLIDNHNYVELAKREEGSWVPVPLEKDSGGSGGSIIGTSRVEDLLPTEGLETRMKRLQNIVDTLVSEGLDILYIIGGDGTMKAAHAIVTELDRRYKDDNNHLDRQIAIAAIPKTMDNDVLWVWQSFGFMSAVDKAKEFAVQLHTEAKSNPRLCVMQLFGSDSGFVVSHTALASNVCDLALIPEVEFDMDTVFDHIKKKLLSRRNDQAYGLILMGETAIPTDAEKYLDDKEIELTEKEIEETRKFLSKEQSGTERRVYGQTPDELRRASLKIVSKVLQARIVEEMGEQDTYWKTFRVFTNEPRHLIRAVDPTPLDEIFAHRLGTLAVDNAMAGYTDFMISQWLTEYVLVPLQLVVLGRKRVYQDGIFWGSVVAATGQPGSLIREGVS